MTIRQPAVAVVKAGLSRDKEEEHDFDADRTVGDEGTGYWFLCY